MVHPMSAEERHKSAEPRSGRPARPKGRPPLLVDFVAIRDRLDELVGIPGAVSKVAREFGVSRAWLYRHDLC